MFDTWQANELNMDEREKLKKVLEKKHPDFRKHLHLDDSFLIGLVAVEVLTGPESEEVKGIKEESKRVDHLLGILMKRPFKTFSSFLKILREHDEDLHKGCIAALTEYGE